MAYKPTRFIEIDPKEGRVTRFTAHDNTLRKLQDKRSAEANRKTTECLEAEQWRLIQTWFKS